MQTWGILFVSVLALVIMILLCSYAYNCGKRSGNITVSLILILFVGGIIGAFHLFGTSRCKTGMNFDGVMQKNRQLKNEKLELEIQQLIQQSKK